MSTTAEDEKMVSSEKQSKTGDKKATILSTREAYFASLNEWVKHANMSQNAQALFPWYLLTNYPTIFQSPGSFPNNNLPNFSANINLNQTATPPAAANIFSLRLLDQQAQNELIGRTGGYEYVIAPFWKRLIAETIDVILLLLLKILVIFTVMNLFDMDLGIELDKETLRKAVDDDDYASFVAISMDFLAMSSDLLMLEIITKIVVCFNEAIWTTMYQGKTPGKAIMNLRIVYVEAIIPLQQQPPQLLQAPQIGFQNREPFRAVLYPAETPGFFRALLRALGKNVIMTLLFPMCFIMIFFKNNRTAYDIVTKTVVVECDQNPVFRRPTRQG